eukprot:15358060-Ditylum_brightwellii.AAC.1
MPTSKPTTSALHTEVFTKLHKLGLSINKQFIDMQREQFTTFSSCIADVTSQLASNEESSQKIESNLNTESHNNSKFDYHLNKEEEIYDDQQTDIKQCITEVERHFQNNNFINSQL